jgi:hypothetical protein
VGRLMTMRMWGGGNPVGLNDPLGPWSVSIGGYAGVGGEISFGRDSNTCQGFMTFRAGWGSVAALS